MNKRNQRQNPLAVDIIPQGLKRCPFKKQKKGDRYFDQFCDKERCALWNEQAGRCGAIR